MPAAPLPVDPIVSDVVAALRGRGAAVLVAPPGSGKTTRVPPALCADGPAILLQPRRVAARAIARRIAEEQRWTLGEEVGWQVRFERRFSARTRLLVATEGVLTARLQSDPLLSGFATVVLDEFHERSLHADLALALARQAALARGDLRILVMSATLDAGPVSAFLGGCPVIEVAWRPHPVEIAYAPGVAPADAVRRVLAGDGGDVLCFLPGAGEIRRAANDLHGVSGISVRPLHGGLTSDEQDAALAPGPSRKVVLATNLAETSLTVAGVTDVVDGGWHKVLRYDPASGIDRLETERIGPDSAEQRAGRAGRTGPGRALRLWDPRDILRPQRDPDVRRVDISAPALEILAWGGDPRTFEWFEAPPADALDAALRLLARLGAVAAGRLTPLGEAMHRLPLHPRLARVLLACGGSPRVAAACALLSERPAARPASHATRSDVLARLDAGLTPPLAAAARDVAAIARRVLRDEAPLDGEDDLLRALLAGYPDRVARRRAPGDRRLLMASGTGAVLGPESGVGEGEFLVALDVTGGGAEARVRLASVVERAWLGPTHRDLEHRFDPASASVRATQRDWYEALLLAERPAALDRERAEAVLVAEALGREPSRESRALANRLRFAGLAFDRDAAVRAACRGRTTLPDLELAALLSGDERQALDRLAPATVAVPSGRHAAIEYRDDGAAVAAVKLQELFGLAESPRIGPRGEPLLLELLAPNGRPVQTTRDLRGFWERTYPEVRKELRGRYPRHPWPEDPWTAPPTARAKPRSRR